MHPVDVGDPTAMWNWHAQGRDTIIGPEVPLCAGAVDSLADAGIAFGPNAKAAGSRVARPLRTS